MLGRVLTLMGAAVVVWPGSAAGAVGLGAGRTPDVAVDRAGRAHVVMQVGSGSEAPVEYCRVPRKARSCDARIRLPFAGHYGAPKILRRADGLLVVVAARFDNASWPTQVVTSADGGRTWTAPAVVGTAYYDIAEAALTRDGGAIDVLHRSSLGHVLQRVPLSGGVEGRTLALEGGGQWNTSPALAELRGGRALYVRDTYDRALVMRPFAGGDLYAPSAWPARRFGGRRQITPDLATGRRGNWLAVGDSGRKQVLLRRLRVRRSGRVGADRSIVVRRRTHPAITRVTQDGRGRLNVFWLSLGRFLGSECPANACISSARVTWKRRHGKRRLVLGRTHVLARSSSATATPMGDLAASAGPRGRAAAVYATNGGTVRLVRAR